MPDLITGLVRTIVTLLVGATLTALINLARRELGLHIEVDDFTKATIVSGVTAFVSMLWYATFATLERRWPAFGIFLGWPKAPHYDVEAEVKRKAEEKYGHLLWGRYDRVEQRRRVAQELGQADAEVPTESTDSQRKGYPLKE